MKTRCLATLLFLLAGSLSSLRGQQLLSGVTELRFQAATSTATGPRSVTFQNVRARSSSTTLDDYLEIDYKADLATLQMRPSAVRVFKGVGVYNIEEHLFMKDVPATFTWKTPAGTSYTSNSASSVAVTCDGTKPIVLSNLTAGMSLTIHWQNLTGPLITTLTGPGEAKPTKFPQSTDAGYGGSLYATQWTILKSGTYNLWVVPETGSSSVSFNFQVGNENSSTGSLLSSGQSFSTNFSSTYFNYGKRKVLLKAGQQLTTTFSGAFGSSDSFVIRSDGAKVGRFGNVQNGTSFAVTADIDGYYYVVLRSKGFASGGVTARVDIQ